MYVGLGVGVGRTPKNPRALSTSYEAVGSAALLQSPADAILEYTFTFVPATTDANIRFRSPVGEATYWRLRALPTGVLTLYEFDGTTLNSRASVASVFTAGSFRVTVKLLGTSIKVTVNGVQKIDHPSAVGQTLPNWRATTPSPSTLTNLIGWVVDAPVTL